MKAYLALYHGAHGKTIRVEIRDKSTLRQLYECVNDLGTGKQDSAIIYGQQYSHYNVRQIALKIGLEEEISTVNHSDDFSIIWYRSQDDWCYIRDLIASMLAADEKQPCEQDIDTDEYFVEIEWAPGTTVV